MPLISMHLISTNKSGSQITFKLIFVVSKLKIHSLIQFVVCHRHGHGHLSITIKLKRIEMLSESVELCEKYFSPFPIEIVNKCFYGHFRSTCPLPDSSYSCDEIHICWNVPMLAKIEPPIQAPKRRSTVPLAAINFNRVFDGARWAKSRFKRSGKPYTNSRKSNYFCLVECGTHFIYSLAARCFRRWWQSIRTMINGRQHRTCQRWSVPIGRLPAWCYRRDFRPIWIVRSQSPGGSRSGIRSESMGFALRDDLRTVARALEPLTFGNLAKAPSSCTVATMASIFRAISSVCIGAVLVHEPVPSMQWNKPVSSRCLEIRAADGIAMTNNRPPMATSPQLGSAQILPETIKRTTSVENQGNEYWRKWKLTWTGTADVCVAPLSTTKAVARPLANAAKTAFFTTKNAGTLYFSNINSVRRSRFVRTFHEHSLNSTGWYWDSDAITLAYV